MRAQACSRRTRLISIVNAKTMPLLYTILGLNNILTSSQLLSLFIQSPKPRPSPVVIVSSMSSVTPTSARALGLLTSHGCCSAVRQAWHACMPAYLLVSTSLAEEHGRVTIAGRTDIRRGATVWCRVHSAPCPPLSRLRSRFSGSKSIPPSLFPPRSRFPGRNF